MKSGSGHFTGWVLEEAMKQTNSMQCGEKSLLASSVITNHSSMPAQRRGPDALTRAAQLKRYALKIYVPNIYNQ